MQLPTGFAKKKVYQHKLVRSARNLAKAYLTVVTIVEPRLLVVVTGTPDTFPPAAVELPLGKAVAVVTKVVPRESVVVIATAPPATKSPIVEVISLPAESVRVATTTLAVLRGNPVLVTVDSSLVVAEALLLSLADTWLDLLAET